MYLSYKLINSRITRLKSFFIFILVPWKWRPNCYLAHRDFLIFEDLNQQGYQHHINGEKFDLAHVQCVLKSLARMHASGLAYEINQLKDRTIQDEFGIHLTEISFIPENSWFTTSLDVSYSSIYTYLTFI